MWIHSTLKDFMENACKDGLTLDSTQFSVLRTDIEHAIAFLNTRFGPLTYSVVEAIHLANLNIQSQNEKAEDIEGLIRTIYKCDDSFYIVSLLNWTAFAREGKLMQHCLGDTNQDYLRKLNENIIEIWSLRDRTNTPYCTMEFEIKRKRVLQIKGRRNGNVEVTCAKHVRDFLAHKKEDGEIVSFDRIDLLKIGITNPNAI
jgi:hypothetical protein